MSEKESKTNEINLTVKAQVRKKKEYQKLTSIVIFTSNRTEM